MSKPLRTESAATISVDIVSGREHQVGTRIDSRCLRHLAITLGHLGAFLAERALLGLGGIGRGEVIRRLQGQVVTCIDVSVTAGCKVACSDSKVLARIQGSAATSGDGTGYLSRAVVLPLLVTARGIAVRLIRRRRQAQAIRGRKRYSSTLSN